MIYTHVAFFALVLHFTSIHGTPRPRRFSLQQNQWEIEHLTLQRWNRPGFPSVGAQFWLYRSYNVSCNLSGGLEGVLPLLFAGEMCGYFVPDNPVACVDGIKVYSDDPDNIWQSTPISSNYWSTCNSYPRAVEGEGEFTEDKKKWLKWRVFDLVEDDLQTIHSPKAREAGESRFISAKFEIVNGVPLKKSNDQVKVFSTILTVRKEDVQCKEAPIGPYGAQYQCSIVFDPNNKRLICENGFSGCSTLVNVTERTESMSEFKSRFSVGVD